MWPNEWPLTISRSLWPIFHGSVILPYILNTICWINVTPGILVPCDPIIDVKIISVGVTYISWFSDFAVYLEYYLLDKWHTWDITSMWPNEWPTYYIKVIVTYISWFSDFALYLEYYLLDKCHTWDISSLWPDYWRQNISLLVWPIFHGSVILPYILNTICWINVTPGILVPCDPTIDVKIYLFWCDLYFMVQWFCLISWILFVG